MERDEAGQGKEALRDAHLRARWWRICRLTLVEKVERRLIFAEFFPDDLLGCQATVQSPARRRLPAFEGRQK